MDFPIAKPVTEELRKRTEHEIYGYTRPGPSVIEAVVDRMQRKYNWKIKPEWIVFTPGVVSALNVAVKAFTHPGDEVIIQGPVYYPIWSAVRNNGCIVTSNELKLIDKRYEIDFNDLGEKFDVNTKVGMMPAPSRATMIILCSPHNPVGRVWAREELIRLGEIIIEHGAIVVSDEIHCELLFNGSKHVPFASISNKFEQHSLVCMGATKTFNLAGVAASTIIIPNDKLRTTFTVAQKGILPQPNVFAIRALEAAYRYGDDWLEQLLNYLQGNLEFLIQYFEERIPKIKTIRPEGTYLVWLDCRQLQMDPMNLRTFMREKAKVGLEDGYLFGPSGAGFQRVNIACTRATLAEALRRVENAVNSLEERQ